jgi:hypothetical protein
MQKKNPSFKEKVKYSKILGQALNIDLQILDLKVKVKHIKEGSS